MKLDVIKLAMEAGLAFDSEEFPDIWQTYMHIGKDEIERFAALVIEECEKVCEQANTAGSCIAALRELKEPE